MKTPLVLLLAGLASSLAGAFTLDAVGYEGGGLSPNPLSILVPGYGEVVMETGPGSQLAVNSAYRNDGPCESRKLRFQAGDSVKISLSEPEPSASLFDFTRQTDGHVLELDAAVTAARAETAPGLGMVPATQGSGWNGVPVPEATTSMIGLICGVVLAMRRRR